MVRRANRRAHGHDPFRRVVLIMKAENMPIIDPEAQKKAIKEAINEWLNEKFAEFGRWTFYGITAAALAGLVYLALRGQGWTKS